MRPFARRASPSEVKAAESPAVRFATIMPTVSCHFSSASFDMGEKGPFCDADRDMDEENPAETSPGARLCGGMSCWTVE